MSINSLGASSTRSHQRGHSGALDILYNNVGVRNVQMAIHTDKKTADWMMGANFTAIVGMTGVFSDLLLKAEWGSRIVFTRSIGARALFRVTQCTVQCIESCVGYICRRVTIRRACCDSCDGRC